VVREVDITGEGKTEVGREGTKRKKRKRKDRDASYLVYLLTWIQS
jgi:hypothetical protein